MRVHHLINVLSEQFGGAEKIALSLHEGLLSRGHKSSLVSMTKAERPQIPHCSDLGASSPYSPTIIQRLRRYIATECQDGDIIHAHLFPTNFYLSLATRTTKWRGHVVTTEHSTSNRRRSTWWGKHVDRVTYSQFNAIYCISDGTAQSLHDWWPKLQHATHIIENGVTLRFESALTRTSNNASAITIISIGRLHQIKDYETTLKAFRKLVDRHETESTFKLQIVGEGDERGRIEQLIVELKLESQVTLMGYVTDPTELLAQADLFLITSKWEGFGLSAVEAMNAGIPVVASNIIGLRDVVGPDEECGLLCEAGDPDSFCNALHQLLSDSEKRQSMGRRAFDRSRRYTADNMVDRYIEAYLQLER